MNTLKHGGAVSVASWHTWCYDTVLWPSQAIGKVNEHGIVGSLGGKGRAPRSFGAPRSKANSFNSDASLQAQPCQSWPLPEQQHFRSCQEQPDFTRTHELACLQQTLTCIQRCSKSSACVLLIFNSFASHAYNVNSSVTKQFIHCTSSYRHITKIEYAV